MTTLPTIHLNGTSADSLYAEYRTVRKAVSNATDALAAATCNVRDFYPQGSDAWRQACDERTEVFQMLQRVCEYAAQWEMHALDHRRAKH
jgi:hypothetical protein